MKAFGRFAAVLDSFVLGAALAFAMAPATRAETTATQLKPVVWKLSFELAFAGHAPYATKYPNLYSLPYDVDLAVTRDVLNRVIPIALHESGAQRRGLLYGPGGDGNAPVVPSAQLDVEGTAKQVQTARDIAGYLAQQSWVLVSRPLASGDAPAIQVVGRGRELESVQDMSRFVKALKKRAPSLQGFMPVRVGRRAGVRMIDVERKWTVPDVVRFDGAIAAAARENHLSVDTRRFMMQTASGSNDWQRAPRGEEYLRRFDGRGQAALRQRLVKLYAPRVEGWIKAAFVKHAPWRLKAATKAAERAAVRPVAPLMASF